MAKSASFACFDTAIGRCGIAWGENGILAASLPERDEAALRSRLLRHAPGAAETVPGEAIRALIGRVVELTSGQPVDLADTPLDLTDIPAFHRQVYAVALTIKPGETLTYGEVARRLGEPGAAQAVGQALGRNPIPIIIPCHRVLAAGGKTGGFSADGGVETKFRLLAIERARLGSAPTLFDADRSFVLQAPPRSRSIKFL